MIVKLQNATGGGISVDIELTDSPLQIIKKAIEQNGENASIIFQSLAQYQECLHNTINIDSAKIRFALVQTCGLKQLELNNPISDQLLQNMEDLEVENRSLEFVFAMSFCY